MSRGITVMASTISTSSVNMFDMADFCNLSARGECLLTSGKICLAGPPVPASTWTGLLRTQCVSGGTSFSPQTN